MSLILQPGELARYIDSTLLRPDATRADIEKLCAEADALGVAAICVNGSRVVEAVNFLEGSEVKVATVVGFPLGGMDADVKRYETEAAIDNGAQEIEMVLNLGWLKEENDQAVFRELRDVVEAADERIVKVILETALLTTEEIARACKLAVDADAAFVKTSTGYAGRGATVEDVQLMRLTVGPKFGVKAAGGIRDIATALAMIKAGATRLGTSSAAAILAGCHSIT